MSTEHLDTRADEGVRALADAERLLVRARSDPDAAQPAALAALQSLLLHWGERPRGDSVSVLLDQAAETDRTLSDFQEHAVALDVPGQDAHDHAKVFVDAARARLAIGP